MEVFYKLLAILISSTILINAYFIKRVVGTWLFPACVFSLFWFAYTFFPLVILFEVPITLLPLTFITLCVIIFSWTAAFFNWKKALEVNKLKPHSSLIYDNVFLRKFLFFSILFSLAAVLAQISSQDISLYNLLTSPLESAAKYMSLKYTGELKYTFFSPLSLIFSYISILIGGLIYGSSRLRKRKRIALLSFLPSILIIVTQGAKGLLFLSLFLFLGGIMVTKIYNSSFDLFNRKNIFSSIKASLILFVFLVIGFMSRGLYNITNFGVLLFSLRRLFASYMLTHLYAFSDWFSAYLGIPTDLNYDVSNNYFGFYTFYFIGKKIVPKEKLIHGVYGEYFKYQDIIKSNIYTVFRGLIMDFGIFGAFFFLFIMGLFTHLVFYIFLLRKRPVISTALIIFIIGYFYISFIVSLFTWDIIIFSFLFFVAVLFINRYKFVFKKSN